MGITATKMMGVLPSALVPMGCINDACTGSPIISSVSRRRHWAMRGVFWSRASIMNFQLCQPSLRPLKDYWAKISRTCFGSDPEPHTGPISRLAQEFIP